MKYSKYNVLSAFLHKWRSYECCRQLSHFLPQISSPMLSECIMLCRISESAAGGRHNSPFAFPCFYHSSSVFSLIFWRISRKTSTIPSLFPPPTAPVQYMPPQSYGSLQHWLGSVDPIVHGEPRPWFQFGFSVSCSCGRSGGFFSPLPPPPPATTSWAEKNKRVPVAITKHAGKKYILFKFQHLTKTIFVVWCGFLLQNTGRCVVLRFRREKGVSPSGVTVNLISACRFGFLFYPLLQIAGISVVLGLI